MNFNIDLKRKNLEAFHKNTMKRIGNTPPHKWTASIFNIISWGLITIFVMEMFSAYKYQSFVYIDKALIVLTVWFILSLIWQQLYLKIYIKKSVWDEGTILGKWNIDVTTESVKETNGVCSSTFKWESVKAVEKDNINFYLYTDASKAIIIPLEQISSEIEESINNNITRA